MRGLRIVRGLEGVDRETMLACWMELWHGAIGSHRAFIDVEVEEVDGAGLAVSTARLGKADLFEDGTTETMIRFGERVEDREMDGVLQFH